LDASNFRIDDVPAAAWFSPFISGTL